MMTTNLKTSFVPVLVTGEMRSGTTFVANYLNSQADCLVYADFLRSLFIEARHLPVEDVNAVLTERHKNILLSNLVAEGYRVGVSAFQDIQREEFATWFELYLLALKQLDQPQDHAVVGTKATREYDLLPALLDLGIRVIFCLRDPRDILLSAKNRFSDYNLYESIRSWRQSYATACKLKNHPHMHVLQFERLIAEETRPAEIDSLARFLGVTLEEKVTALHAFEGTHFQANTSFGDVAKPFDTNALYRWKNDLESPEVQFTSTFLEKEIAALQYQPFQSDRAEYRSLYRGYTQYALKQRVKTVLLAVYQRVFK
jgi:hypothetical protein